MGSGRGSPLPSARDNRPDELSAASLTSGDRPRREVNRRIVLTVGGFPDQNLVWSGIQAIALPAQISLRYQWLALVAEFSLSSIQTLPVA